MNTLRKAKDRISDRLIELATINGVSNSRTIEEMRYHAGICAGLKAAMVIIEEVSKSTEEEDEDGR